MRRIRAYAGVRGRRPGAPGRAARVLRRCRDGHQGVGMDGPRLRAARLLLPRDRPQPARRRPLPLPRAWCSSTTSPRCPPVGPSCCRRTARHPRWSSAARQRGSVVVDAVCPLVTKVHHEVRARAGKGYRILYVGHEGHEEAVGTMAVAPDSIHLLERSEDVAALPDFHEPRRAARPDHAQPPGVGRRARRRAGPLPRRVDARTVRPVLRHHQPPVRAGRHGR